MAASHPEDEGLVVVTIDSLDDAEAPLLALDLMVEASERLDRLVHGDRLAFRVRDRHGTCAEEPFIYARALEHPDGPQRLVFLLRNFLMHPRAHGLRYDAETPALGHGALQLGLAWVEALSFVAHYCQVMGSHGEQFFQATLLPALVARHGQAEVEAAFGDAPSSGRTGPPAA